MDPQGDGLEGGPHQPGVRERVEEVAARRVEDVDLAALRRFDHFGRREPSLSLDREAVLLGEFARSVWTDGDPAGQSGRVCTHLGAALDARVAADGHEARAGPPDVPASKGEVDDRLNVLGATDVL